MYTLPCESENSASGLSPPQPPLAPAGQSAYSSPSAEKSMATIGLALSVSLSCSPRRGVTRNSGVASSLKSVSSSSSSPASSIASTSSVSPSAGLACRESGFQPGVEKTLRFSSSADTITPISPPRPVRPDASYALRQWSGSCCSVSGLPVSGAPRIV